MGVLHKKESVKAKNEEAKRKKQNEEVIDAIAYALIDLECRTILSEWGVA